MIHLCVWVQECECMRRWNEGNEKDINMNLLRFKEILYRFNIGIFISFEKKWVVRSDKTSSGYLFPSLYMFILSNMLMRWCRKNYYTIITNFTHKTLPHSFVNTYKFINAVVIQMLSIQNNIPFAWNKENIDRTFTITHL